MTKEEMIKSLNEDLAGELGAIIQYLTYAAKVTMAPTGRNWHSFFLAKWPMSRCTRST